MGAHHSASSNCQCSSSGALIGSAKQARAKSLPQVKCLPSAWHGRHSKLQRLLQRASHDSSATEKQRSGSSSATNSSSAQTLASQKASRNQLNLQQQQQEVAHCLGTPETLATVASNGRSSEVAASLTHASNGHVSAADKLISSINGKRVLRKLARDSCQTKATSNGVSSNAADRKQQQQEARRQDFANSRKQRNANGSSSFGADDSDVFIYPPNYRHLNECKKCARDNKICNCTVNELPSSSRQSSSSSSSSAAAAAHSHEECSSLSPNSSPSSSSGPLEDRQPDCLPTAKATTTTTAKLPEIAECGNDGTETATSGHLSLLMENCAKVRTRPAIHKVASEPQFKRIYQVNIALANCAPLEREQDSRLRLLAAKQSKTLSENAEGGHELQLFVSPPIGTNSLGESNASIVTTISPIAEAAQREAGHASGREKCEKEELCAIRKRASSVPIGQQALTVSPIQESGAAECEAAKAGGALGGGSTVQATASLSRLDGSPIVTFAHSSIVSSTKNSTTTTTTTLEYLSSKTLEGDCCDRREEVEDAMIITSTSISIAANKRLNGRQLVSNEEEEMESSLQAAPSWRRPNREEGQQRHQGSAAAISQPVDIASVVDANILEYSPILTSVRDYIETLNPGLLALRTAPTLTSQLPAPKVRLESQQLLFGRPIESVAPAAIAALPLTVAVPSCSMLDGCMAAAAAATAPANTVAILPSVASAASQAPTIVSLAEGLTIMASSCTSNSIAASDTIRAAASELCEPSPAMAAAEKAAAACDQSGSGGGGLESPKKSIFEGASKDEILEYLEDARERVPEVLIAADDVMVLNDNELILVNQLEPNLPATPISIVEAADAKLLLATSTAGLPLSCTEEPSKMERKASQRRGSLRNRISSALGSSIVSSSSSSAAPSDSLDERMLQPSGGQHDSTGSPLESSRFSSPDDAGWPLNLGTNERSLAGGADSAHQYRYFRSMIGAGDSTLEGSLDYQLSVGSSETTPEPCLVFSDTDTGGAGSSAAGGYRPDSQLDFSPGETSATDYEDQQQQQQQPGRALKRKSASEVSKQHHFQLHHRLNNAALAGMECKGDNIGEDVNKIGSSTSDTMMQLQKRLMNNNSSLASPSSSSPSDSSSSSSSSSSSASSSGSPNSSATPTSASSTSSSSSSTSSSSSSSASSNRTSGNYSATSALYASSSLSCSSPFIALGSGLSVGQTSGGKHLGLREVSANNYASSSAAAAAASSRQSAVANRTKAGEALKLTGEELNASRLSVIEEQRQFDSSKQVVAERPLVQQHQHQQRPPPARHHGGQYASINHKVNNQRHHHHHYSHHKPLSDEDLEASTEFQCLDCDQLIVADASNLPPRLLAGPKGLMGDVVMDKTNAQQPLEETKEIGSGSGRQSTTLHRVYGLPLCKLCEKKRTERKEIISEFIETELKYGGDLKIINDEFYRPMQIAGLLNKDQIRGIFLNLDELMLAHCRFAERLVGALNEAHAMGDTDYDRVSIGRLFVESSDMLQTFESYCVRQGSAACLLARLAKEKELLRIFLRVSQMENTLLRRMNLAAFLMVPVQRVTKYPLLLNRLYKVTPYHHKDRESLRDAQLRVELHLEHINQQTKGVSATTKIWRRISNLSAAHNYNSHYGGSGGGGGGGGGSGSGSGGGGGGLTNRRGQMNAEDIGYIKLRRTALEVLKWERDETQFIHSGKINFVPLNEYLVKQKVKSLRYMTAHALLVVCGKPNWKYAPALVKSTLDARLMTPTPGGFGLHEAALLLFREKNGRFVSCREPLLLSNCVLSNDCSQWNCEYGNLVASLASTTTTEAATTAPTGQQQQQQQHSHQRSLSTSNAGCGNGIVLAAAFGAQAAAAAAAHQQQRSLSGASACLWPATSPNRVEQQVNRKSLPGLILAANNQEEGTNTLARSECKLKCSSSSTSASDSISMSSLKSLPEERTSCNSASSQSKHCSPPPPMPPPLPSNQAPRSYSLASALSRAPIAQERPSSAATKTSATASSNSTILNQLITKVNRGGAGSGTEASNGTIGQQQQSVAKLSSSSNNTCTAQLPSEHNSLVHYNHFFHAHHQPPYGDYEESFEIHERLSKESLLLRADTPLKTRYWLQLLRYHAKDLGHWRARRNGLANIMMMMRQQ